MFLQDPELTDSVQALYDEDLAVEDYVANLTRAWAWMPEAQDGLFDLMAATVAQSGVSFRERAVLVTAAASNLGDSYCSIAWGNRLASASNAETAAAVVAGTSSAAMTDREVAIADWARRLATDANATEQSHVDRLREVGFDDAQIFAMTVYVSLRIAFAVVNDGLGVPPDSQLIEKLPAQLSQAITFGRRPAAHG